MTATLDAMKAAQTYTIDKMHSEVTFQVRHLLTQGDHAAGHLPRNGERSVGNVRAGFETTLTLNRKDFGLTWNAALETGGFLVGDEVRINLSIQAIAQ
jgi:polyisoprenoid-binding protein YceI